MNLTELVIFCHKNKMYQEVADKVIVNSREAQAKMS